MEIEDKVIDCLKATPELTPIEIESFLEWLQDRDMLSEEGDKLKNEFLKIFWK